MAATKHIAQEKVSFITARYDLTARCRGLVICVSLCLIVTVFITPYRRLVTVNYRAVHMKYVGLSYKAHDIYTRIIIIGLLSYFPLSVSHQEDDFP